MSPKVVGAHGIPFHKFSHPPTTMGPSLSLGCVCRGAIVALRHIMPTWVGTWALAMPKDTLWHAKVVKTKEEKRFERFGKVNHAIGGFGIIFHHGSSWVILLGATSHCKSHHTSPQALARLATLQASALGCRPPSLEESKPREPSCGSHTSLELGGAWDTRGFPKLLNF